MVTKSESAIKLVTTSSDGDFVVFVGDIPVDEVVGVDFVDNAFLLEVERWVSFDGLAR